MCERSSKYLPGPLSHAPFRVDDFSKGALVYFLTHAHTDHLRGLRDTWREGRIYCTEVTKQLILLKYPGLNERLFRVLSVGETKLIVLNESYSLCVTVLDAYHCAGSCMFLFESKHFGRVLHTGDFRYEVDKPLPNILLENEESTPACVYLDNTYGLRSSPKNPTRAEVKDILMEVLKLYPSTTRFVFCMHGLGKEELLVEAAKTLKSRVIVDEERMEQIQAFGDSNMNRYFTRDLGLKNKSRIVCVRRGRGGRLGEETEDDPDALVNEEDDETSDFHRELDIGADTDVFITPSGWCGYSAFDNLKHLVQKPPASLPCNLKVPYSLHASFNELVRFVRDCGFRVVVPIVNIRAEHRNELGIESLIHRWVKPVDAEDTRDNDVIGGGEADSPRAIMTLVERKGVAAPLKRIAASPQSHYRRLEAMRTRLQKTDEEFDDFEIVFRREGSSRCEWTKAEDDILRTMQRKRVEWDCSGHELLRKKLRRSDNEIFLRLTLMHNSAGLD